MVKVLSQLNYDDDDVYWDGSQTNFTNLLIDFHTVQKRNEDNVWKSGKIHLKTNISKEWFDNLTTFN